MSKPICSPACQQNHFAAPLVAFSDLIVLRPSCIVDDTLTIFSTISKSLTFFLTSTVDLLHSPARCPESIRMSRLLGSIPPLLGLHMRSQQLLSSFVGSIVLLSSFVLCSGRLYPLTGAPPCSRCSSCSSSSSGARVWRSAQDCVPASALFFAQQLIELAVQPFRCDSSHNVRPDELLAFLRHWQARCARVHVLYGIPVLAHLSCHVGEILTGAGSKSSWLRVRRARVFYNVLSCRQNF